ncbi:beta-lactamase [Loktanella sp. 5RATIMAR09]|uniref:serine hydrolase domain-containing protein n=1 Tax=Loktanella sp. 5RATIMAR09 TaxID=1225655 RepID=UPI0006EB9FDC|nr:serine hydrolase domain-containing protein [Loktanella sp. 5RATIMAR09]KQI71354.1 beta-lactamase [Loktanella sp. 5RATIMAR09]
MLARLLTAVVMVCAATSAPLMAQDGPDLSAQLETTLAGFQDRYGFPGATAAIALPDGTVVVAAVGLADIEAGRAMIPETPMLAASIGKTFVAATVLALESEGVLAQSDLLADHLRGRPWFGNLPNAETMTVGHLLHHQSGLPDHPHLSEFQAAAAARIAAGGDAFTPEEVLGFASGHAHLFASGTAWSYSDTGYILLGLLIEEVSGRTYYNVVQERFLGPLELSGTIPSDQRAIPGLAVGYTIPENPFGLPERTADAEDRLVWDPSVEWTGGGLASTAHDLALWGHLLFGGAAMDAPYLDRLLDGVPVSSDAPDILYGAGVAIYADTPRGPVYGHGGWIPAYVSSLRHYADHRVTVAFQINSDVGVVDDSTDVVPALEAALADLAVAWITQAGAEP